MKTKVDLGNGADSAAPSHASISEAARRAERRSWIILYLAFLNCSMLVVLGVAWLLDYRATATNMQRATIGVSKGLVSYRPEATAEPRLITSDSVEVVEGTTVQTGPNSQATLTLFDGSEVRLLSNARLSLDAMRTGKFEDSKTALAMRLENGVALFAVAGVLPADQVQVELGSSHVHLGGGEFLLWAEPEVARISVYHGNAFVTSEDKQVALAANQRAIDRRTTGLTDALPIEENLLVNGDFSRGFESWKGLDDLEVQRDSYGQRRLETVQIDGRQTVALRLTRETSLDRHNKTGVIQEINRDVRGYKSLKLRAEVRLLSSKLDAGGYAGTEYPMTFAVFYEDDKGGEPNWMHGFYYKNEQNRPAQFGELIPQGVWHSYEVELMDQPNRPALIKELRIFGAGHDFDAMVADVQLIAK